MQTKHKQDKQNKWIAIADEIGNYDQLVGLTDKLPASKIAKHDVGLAILIFPQSASDTILAQKVHGKAIGEKMIHPIPGLSDLQKYENKKFAGRVCTLNKESDVYHLKDLGTFRGRVIWPSLKQAAEGKGKAYKHEEFKEMTREICSSLHFVASHSGFIKIALVDTIANVRKALKIDPKNKSDDQQYYLGKIYALLLNIVREFLPPDEQLVAYLPGRKEPTNSEVVKQTSTQSNKQGNKRQKGDNRTTFSTLKDTLTVNSQLGIPQHLIQTTIGNYKHALVSIKKWDAMADIAAGLFLAWDKGNIKKEDDWRNMIMVKAEQLLEQNNG